ncbi:MAG: hypothetical protein UY41_C0041G0005 [Candidatus Moranbacteria bacterium GW2011_GWE1_49_15]|nr:MAG: hypothetical protein UX75_C0022G0006 [Candidatus Moranbacteria bacterium GW2011_GWE2_47_10]KKW05745.1 MAG: hypothetical protein UY41_C0041G0005 [Candidatus Moranbacteria bacterium GW2011_GWE1_49_15]HBP01206.1 hypothetical protein [Candidatus Moranbacteria bacterium]
MPEILIHVIEAQFDLSAIKQKVLQEDMTFAPMGSGGFEIKEVDENCFAFKDRDLSPRDAFRVRVRERQIWSPHGIQDFFYRLLSAMGIPFSSVVRSFPNPQEERKAFETCSVCESEEAFEKGIRFDKCESCARKLSRDARKELVKDFTDMQLSCFETYEQLEETLKSMATLSS